MAWRDELVAASFRGVEFGVQERGLETGRREVVHEYPRRDEPFTEDMGRRARRFSVRAFVLGSEYTRQRDALLEACERSGPGEYVDRWRGAINVVCASCRLTESFTDGGICYFDLEFVEAGANVVPAPLRARAPVIAPVLDDAVAAIEEAFDQAFDTLSGSSYLQTEAQLVLGGLAGVLERAGDRIGNVVSGNTVRREISSIVSDSARLVRSGAELGPKMVEVTSHVALLEPDARVRFDRMLEVADVDQALRPTSTATANRRRAKANQDALAGLVRQAATIEAARAIGVMTIQTDRDAAIVRERLRVRIDAELDTASEIGADLLFTQLRQVFATASEIIRIRGATAARLITVRPVATEPAEVIAYRLYGDASRAQEIVDRNRVVHPLFVPGAEDLAVLTANG